MEIVGEPACPLRVKTIVFLTSALPDENVFYNGRVAHAETPQRLFGTLPGLLVWGAVGGQDFGTKSS